jgi:hypothetical protein
VLADLGGVGAGGQAGLGPGRPGLDVDAEGGQLRQVEHDPAVIDAVAGQAVTAAADGQLGAGLGRQGDDPGDLLGAGGPHDGRRAAVPFAVEDLAGLVVAGVAGAGDPAVEAALELGDGDGRGG